MIMVICQIVGTSSHEYQIILNMIISVTDYVFLTCAAHYWQACLYLPTRAATLRTRVCVSSMCSVLHRNAIATRNEV